MNEINMSKSKSEMRAEYDFSKGIRGKYAKLYKNGANLVVLDPEVAKVFPDSISVNIALRGLLSVARRATTRSFRKKAPVSKKATRVSKTRRRA